MNLVSYGFLGFLALVLALYYVVPRRFQWIFLLAASCVFYLSGGPVYLLYPLITTVTTWFLAGNMGRISAASKAHIKEQKLDREQKKAYQAVTKRKLRRRLVLGLLLNFGILAVLKFMNEAAAVGWILPLGISYYTFQSMGYLIDVSRGKYEPEPSLPRFALFVSFFPQMVSGPISRFDVLKKELFSEHPLDGQQLSFGLQRVLWGYFKKLVIADRLGPAVSMITSSPETYGGIYAILGMLGYTLQLYADFSGCMDIVLGVSQCMGIRLPENFNRPFGAESLAELWRRWHMTLTQWLREYIFFPVSTSRFSKWLSRFNKKAPVYAANITVWFVTGIWHGVTWRFVAWGLANGVVLMISQELTGWYRKFHKRFAFADSRGYGCFRKLRTGLLFSWLLSFQYYSFGMVFVMTGSMIAGSRIGQLFDGSFAALGLTGPDLAVLAVGILLMYLVSRLKESKDVRQILAEKPLAVRYAVIFSLFLLVLVTGTYGHGYDAGTFIYNRF